MKALKYLLIAAGSLVVLAGLVIAVIAATFDPNKYKPDIAALVKEKTGRTLTMEGRIGLSFFPGIGAVVGKISLSEPGSGKIFAKLDEAKLSLALMPLFSRRVVVDRVTLSGLTVDLVQRKGGRTNFGDLAGAGGQPARAAAPKAAPPGAAISFDVGGIEVRSSAIGWRDESSGTELKASVAEFKTGRIASGVPGKLSLSARIEEAKPSILRPPRSGSISPSTASTSTGTCRLRKPARVAERGRGARRAQEQRAARKRPSTSPR